MVFKRVALSLPATRERTLSVFHHRLPSPRSSEPLQRFRFVCRAGLRGRGLLARKSIARANLRLAAPRSAQCRAEHVGPARGG